MATLERIGLAQQIVNNFFGMSKDMRANAALYKAAVAADKPVGDVVSVMAKDANEYLRRLQWVTDLAARNPTLMANALSDVGIDVAEVTGLRNALRAAANHTKSATLATGAQVGAEADYILANVPPFERLW